MTTLLSTQKCLPSHHAFTRILMFTNSLEKNNCNKGHANNFSLLVACPIKVNKKETTNMLNVSSSEKKVSFSRFCLNKKKKKANHTPIKHFLNRNLS